MNVPAPATAARPVLAPGPRPRHLLIAAFAACLFLLIVGAKWAVFERFGSPMPDWDQWDAEAMETFVPWFEHDHFWRHLFNAHNEHRVVLTKLQCLALGLLNGQWDARLEAVTNALLHAALGVALWLVARRWVARPWHAVLFALTAALFGLPVAWQNVVAGFHSQQFWLLGTSFVAVLLLPFARLWSGAWWAGALAATLALGSMGSGFLAVAVVALVVGLRAARREIVWRETWPTIALAIAAIAIGAVTRVQPEWHQKLKAANVHDFILSIVRSLAWPLRDHDWMAAVLWLPWALVAWRAFAVPDCGETAERRSAQRIAALGGWVLAQVLATAYARGAGADYPAPRYMDTLAFGAMVNAIALGWLLARSDAKRLLRLAHAALALAWLATLGTGLSRHIRDVLRIEMPEMKHYYGIAEANMRRYLATDDPRYLVLPDIPFPYVDGLVERLAHPSLRALMPVPLRAPLPMTAAEPAGSTAFSENDARGADPTRPPRAGLSPRTPPLDSQKTWGSFGADEAGAAVTGTWRSAPLTAALGGWLKFETAGQAGDPNDGVRLELRDATTDAVLTRIEPDRIPNDTWRAAYVRAPARPFVVVAQDRHAARWLAFSAPTEMGWLSYAAWRATKHGMVLVYFAAAATAALGAAAALAGRFGRAAARA